MPTYSTGSTGGSSALIVVSSHRLLPSSVVGVEKSTALEGAYRQRLPSMPLSVPCLLLLGNQKIPLHGYCSGPSTFKIFWAYYIKVNIVILAGCGCVGPLNEGETGEHFRRGRRESQCQGGKSEECFLTSFPMRQTSVRVAR